MATLQIPDEDLPAIKILAGLPDSDFDSLEKALTSASPSLSPKSFSVNVKAKLPSFEPRRLNAVILVLFNLYAVMERQNLNADTLAREIARAAFEADKTIDQKLEPRLNRLFTQNETFRIMVKAADVSSEHERGYCRSRILSEIRPIFSDSTEKISAAVVEHSLQIGFHDAVDGDHKEIYFSLDDKDLEELLGTIQRAQKKAVALKALLKSASVLQIER
jgi:hypothetical protein